MIGLGQQRENKATAMTTTAHTACQFRDWLGKDCPKDGKFVVFDVDLNASGYAHLDDVSDGIVMCFDCASDYRLNGFPHRQL